TLNARHFQSASKDAPEPPDNVGRIDVAKLRARVGTAIDAVRKLFRNSEVAPAINPLERVLADARAAGAPPNTLDALRAALKAIADAGFNYALPTSASGSTAAQLEMLGAQADAVLKRFAALSPA